MKDKIVYVVEDNASDFKFVKRALKKAGVDGENISHITNGEHVLRLLNGTNLLPDLIMLDIEMKPDGIDGLEVLREIRSDVKLSSIKVAVMSGNQSLLSLAGKSADEIFYKGTIFDLIPNVMEIARKHLS